MGLKTSLENRKINKFHFLNFWWTVNTGWNLKFSNLLWTNIYWHIEVALIIFSYIKSIEHIWKKTGRSHFRNFENFERDFGTLGLGIIKIWPQIRTRRLRNRLNANIGQFSCINCPKNNQLAYFFGHPLLIKINCSNYYKINFMFLASIFLDHVEPCYLKL